MFKVSHGPALHAELRGVSAGARGLLSALKTMPPYPIYIVPTQIIVYLLTSSTHRPCSLMRLPVTVEHSDTPGVHAVNKIL